MPPSLSAAKQFSQHIREWLGTRVVSDLELASLAEAGLPLSTVIKMTQHGLTRDEVHHLVIHRRTFKHRKGNKQKLSKDESDRAIRAARILAQAETSFGNAESALAWMRQPKLRFEGRTPIQMMTTEAGGRLVEQMLLQIDEGMFT